MSPKNVIVLGAGAAGTTAARILAGSEDVAVTLIGRTGEIPYNRTLVNKGVALGLLTPEQAVIPGVAAISDTATKVDVDEQTVELASGRIESYNALLVATGSSPRWLESGIVAGEVSGRVTSLHSLEDATRVRDFLATLNRPGHIVISGAGLVAAETATLLRGRGHNVTLLARSVNPGVAVFGEELAQRLAAAHEVHLDTAFGHSINEIHPTEDRVEIVLSDGTVLVADLLIVAHGTKPIAPGPWATGVVVDPELRAAVAGVYAAGGVAIHDDPDLGRWRIDHWADAAAQGEHAALTILADLRPGPGPGPYRPRAPFTATVHGMMVAGAGLTAGQLAKRIEQTDPLVVTYRSEAAPIGVLGLEAAPAVFGWMPKLFKTEPVQSLASPTTVPADSTTTNAQGRES